MKNKKNLILGIISLGLLIYGIIRCYTRPSVLIIIAIIFELTACIILLGAWRKENPIKKF